MTQASKMATAVESFSNKKNRSEAYSFDRGALRRTASFHVQGAQLAVTASSE